MDLKILENRQKARRKFQELMLGQVNRALYAYQHVSIPQKRHIVAKIRELGEIKNGIEAKAVEKGYANLCKASIPICMGECCKWHFPKNLSEVDFFIAINIMSTKGVESLVHRLTDRTDRQYQCPMLTEKGCVFSFEERPMVCTIAYPCFAGQSYWEYLEDKKIEIKNIYQYIENSLKSVII